MRKNEKARIAVLVAALLMPFGGGCKNAAEKETPDHPETKYFAEGLTAELAENNVKCGDEKEDAPDVPAQEEREPYSYEGTVFEYAGNAYDMRERNKAVNAIMDCIPVGEYLIIDNHVGPHNGIYTVFNTRTQEFEKDIEGGNLVFYDEDIHTVCYTFWNDICAYDGTVLASYNNLGQYDFICGLSFNEDHTQLEVTIAENDTEERHVEFLDIS